MMATAVLRKPDGSDVFCGSTTPVVGFDHLGPGDDPRLMVCSGVLIETPFDVVVSLYDMDETKLPNRVPRYQMQLSTTPPGDAIVRFGAFGTNLAISGHDASMILTITTTKVFPTFNATTPRLSATTFLPQLGEHLLFGGTVVAPTGTPGSFLDFPGTTPMTLTVAQGNNPPTTLRSGLVRSSFNWEWDGKLNGVLAAPGDYRLQATLDDGGAMKSATVTIPPVTPVFRVSDVAAARSWNPRGGALEYPYTLNPGGTISLEVDGPALAGAACAAGPLPIATRATFPNINAGSWTLGVPMLGRNLRFLPLGSYCLHFEARSALGTLIGIDQKEMTLVKAPPLRLIVTLNPPVPALLRSVPLPGTTRLVPSSPLFVEARAVDDQRRPRPTGFIRVRAMPMLTPTAPGDISVATCIGTSVCRVAVSAATLAKAGGLTGVAGILAFDGSASDPKNPGDDNDVVESTAVGLRAADLTAPSTSSTIMVDAPVVGTPPGPLLPLPHNQTLDVAFHAGPGFNLANPPEAAYFADILRDALEVFKGGNEVVGDSSVMPVVVPPDGFPTPGRFAFWLSQDTATVSVGADGDCVWHGVQNGVPYAEMQAIIHKVNCRDNADIDHATFSALYGAPLIVWHEFHHAAFDLADEYPPDGGYFQTSDLPNVMKDATQCALYGAEPTLCEQIGTTGWWRAAPRPDVMTGDASRENADEKRRATLILTKCKGGQC